MSSKKYVVALDIEKEPRFYYVDMIAEGKHHIHSDISKAEILSEEDADAMVKDIKMAIQGHDYYRNAWTITKVQIDE